jgi:hypothetical protein
MDDGCQSVCWIEKYAEEAYCDLPADHDGEHTCLQAGWEW